MSELADDISNKIIEFEDSIAEELQSLFGKIEPGESHEDAFTREIREELAAEIRPEDHFGEYLSFGSEFRGVQWRYGQERKKVVQQEKPGKDIVRDYADGKLPPDYWEIVARTREYAVPFICDIEFNRGIVRPAINVLNTEGYIDNLPRDIVVEVPGKADAKGIHPIHVGRIPETIAAYMRTQFSIHTLLTEAYRTRSRKLLLQALLLDPVVNSLTEAEKMLDEMLALQSEFLPKFE